MLSKQTFKVSSILNVADLRRCLIAAWSGLHQHVTDEAINWWCGWLRTCIGRNFEHLF